MISTQYFTAPETTSISFIETIGQLIDSIPNKDRIISLSFFGSSCDDNYTEILSHIKIKTQAVFINNTPLITYIAQELNQSGGFAVEVNYLNSDISFESVNFSTYLNTRYACINSFKNRILLLEGVQANSFKDAISIQAKDIFIKIDKILELENFQISDIVRQWNYIGKITEIQEDIQNYQAFNNERAKFYAQTEWPTAYPAATGIGMDCNGLIVSLVAISNGDDFSVYPINNPLQIAAHNYSSTVLIGDNPVKYTPKFERAKIIQSKSNTYCFVSGTAAIRGEQSIENMHVSAQTVQTIQNILYLISNENLRKQDIEVSSELKMQSLRIYVKYFDDIEKVKAEVNKTWPHVPAIYLKGDICRKELLVEIEGFAKEK